MLLNRLYMMSGLVRKTDYNAKIDEIKIKITNITRLATTTELNDVKNKIPNISILVKKQIMTQKYQTLKKNILPFLVIINLRVK